MQYFFILGRNPELSVSELHAVLPAGYKVPEASRQVLLVECAELEVESLMKRLGGTIKIGEVLPEHKRDMVTAICDQVTKNARRDKKLFLGLSAYALDSGVRLPQTHKLRELGISVKRALQAQGRKVRLVTSHALALSSVIVKKEKLLTQGAEIVLLHARDHIVMGKTIAVQEFEEASVRDFGRPQRQMRVGMLPIQLAKIMINLSRAPTSATVLDPFCGFGTILSEALLMGYTNLIGSDLEQNMVCATQDNLAWLQQKFHIPHSTFHIQFFACPAEALSKHLPPRSVDAIVTEPYLGPTRGVRHQEPACSDRPAGAGGSGIMNELSTLYTKAFREFAKILKLGGRVVFIFPAFRHGTALTKTSTLVLPQIKNLGFTPTQLLPSTFNIPHSTFSILYSRPSQHVLREIFVLEFKK